jgi:iron complex outermembrane receptor protein
MLQSVMWPDATLGQGGLLVEGAQLLGTKSRLIFGGRADRFTAKAAKTDVQPAGMNLSPNELYEVYYGYRAEDWSDTAVSGLLRFERFLTQNLTFFTGLSRSVRAADTTERYLGSNNPAGPKRWIGNPRLAAAKNHQLDLGLSSPGQSSTWSVTGFVDQVDDFILRDRAHGQQGILQDDNATIYRNVEARLVGLELEGSHRPGDRLQLSGVVSWVRGENRTDDRPLAQIPPLQGWLQLDYGQERWRAIGLFRWAASQTRVDDDPMTGSGQDYGETPGYGVADLSGSYEILRSLSIVAGVDNLFDRAYATGADQRAGTNFLATAELARGCKLAARRLSSVTLRPWVRSSNADRSRPVMARAGCSSKRHPYRWRTDSASRWRGHPEAASRHCSST